MTDTPPLAYRRTLTGFVPASTAAADFLQQVPVGKLVKLEGKMPRNLGRHRYYWKMLQITVDNTECFDTVQQLHTAIKATLGYGKWIEVPGASRPLFLEDSISFGKMSETDFVTFMEAAARAITKYWLSVSVETLMEEAKDN